MIVVRIGELTVSPMDGYVGAEVRGVDLGAHLRSATLAAIKKALADYHVLRFADQHLTDAQQIALAGQFGTVTPASAMVVAGLGDRQEIAVLDAARGYLSTNDSWHADMTFLPTPPSATVLRPITVPGVGNDTMFASTEAAFDRLSAPVKALCSKLRAVHDVGASARARTMSVRAAHWGGKDLDVLEPVEHPVVVVDPISRRPGLFVNPMFTIEITGMSSHESEDLLSFLYEHVVRPEHVVRLHWQPGDVVLRKNVTIWHRLVPDTRESGWTLHRVSIAGDRPAGVDHRAPTAAPLAVHQ